jgi:hypothetical protein
LLFDHNFEILEQGACHDSDLNASTGIT